MPVSMLRVVCPCAVGWSMVVSMMAMIAVYILFWLYVMNSSHVKKVQMCEGSDFNITIRFVTTYIGICGFLGITQ